MMRCLVVRKSRVYNEGRVFCKVDPVDETFDSPKKSLNFGGGQSEGRGDDCSHGLVRDLRLCSSRRGCSSRRLPNIHRSSRISTISVSPSMSLQFVLPTRPVFVDGHGIYRRTAWS